MTALSWALLALAAAGLAFGLWQWASRRRTLRRLSAMLDRAIAGGFGEDRFDETELSALEGKLARFLRGSAAAKKAVEGEQAAVKASRLEAGIVAPVPACNPVGPLLEGAAEQLSQAAQAKGIALTVELLDGQAAFDPRWTGEALCNVVDNAVKYTPAGGRVTISAQMLDSFCRVDVADTGPGIPEGEQGAVFDRFFRGAGTRAADGLGLGLYLAREILSKQGGYIKVASRPGEGSTFSLYLPREP